MKEIKRNKKSDENTEENGKTWRERERERWQKSISFSRKEIIGKNIDLDSVN